MNLFLFQAILCGILTVHRFVIGYLEYKGGREYGKPVKYWPFGRRYGCGLYQRGMQGSGTGGN